MLRFLLPFSPVFIIKQNPDTMILDSVAGHRRSHERLAEFLASTAHSIEIDAAGECHLCPGAPTLRTYRMVKTSSKLKVEELPTESVLQVAGRPDVLGRYIESFLVDPSNNGGHAHPEHRVAFMKDLAAGSDMTIIEIDDWADDPEGWAAENGS